MARLRFANHPLSMLRAMSMYRVIPAFCVALGVVFTGCSKQQSFVAAPEPWREIDERQCLAAGVVRETPFINSRSALGGPSVCGAARPFEVSATAGGRISMKPSATLRCPMVPAVEHWTTTVVEPAARRAFGEPVVQFKVAASYGCRPRNGVWGAKLSEHGFANALDVSAFVLASGRTVTVREGWNGRFDERQFLRDVHKGACVTFTTVLGPLADAYHRDHFHFDLARHGRDGTHRVCK
jgi:hypothetical protein